MGSPLRYSIPVPERTRVIWTSQAAQELWSPRIARINQAWAAVERASVLNFRSACRQSVSPDELPALSGKVAEQGLGLLILGKQNAGGMYSSRGSEHTSGAFNYNIVLAQDIATARTFSIASKAGQNDVMGDLLGYPPCCIRFFEQAWTKESWMDTTWPMVRDAGSNHVVIDGVHPWNNILLRWLGVRPVPHLPCSFGCPGTRALGEKFAALWPAEELGWMRELLEANIEWNAMKGTAEIRLPILKIATTTDPLTEPVSVRIHGKNLEAQAKGNTFPWPETNAAPSIQPMVFHRRSTEWGANGFSSSEAMFAAHQMVRDKFRTLQLPEVPSVLDLGCGNGILANSLSGDATGVEADAERAAHARSRLKAVYALPILDFVREHSKIYDVALIAEQRLQEMTPEDRWEFMKWSDAHARYVLVYNYSTNTVVTKSVKEYI
jgi:hypothetical protein